jgi:hypothetical protein
MCGKAGIQFQVVANRAIFLCSKGCENRYGHSRALALQLGRVTIDATGTGVGDFVRMERQQAFDSDSHCWHCGKHKKMGEEHCPLCGAQADVPLE